MIDFQGRTGDADVENGLVDTAGEGAGGMNGEQQYWQIYAAMGKTEPAANSCIAQGAELGALWQHSRAVGAGGGSVDIKEANSLVAHHI